MEERNALLRNNLDTLYGANLVAAVCLILVLIPIINLIALIVVLFSAVMIFVAMYRLRNVHDDYHTAFMLSILNLVLTLIGGMMGGWAEAVVEVISSLVSFGQTYYIIRGTSHFLREGGHDDVVEKGALAVRLYVVNLAVSLVTGVIGLLSVELSVVLAVISLAIAIGSLVVYIKYLGAAKDRF